jgi:hypothetical protein
MFYPAGQKWTHTLEASIDVAKLRKLLCDEYQFIVGMLSEPFGAGRGAILAQRAHMLVLVLDDSDGATLAIVPSREMQNLLWSFSNNYAAQWNAHELNALTGHTTWPKVIEHASTEFTEAVRDVARAANGKRKPKPISLDDGVPELPSDYLFDCPSMEDVCAL